jgi:hypothetical protein
LGRHFCATRLSQLGDQRQEQQRAHPDDDKHEPFAYTDVTLETEPVRQGLKYFRQYVKGHTARSGKLLGLHLPLASSDPGGGG